MTRPSSHERPTSAQHQLTVLPSEKTGISRQIDFFLLSCRSEGRAKATLRDYRQKLLRLANYLQEQDVFDAQEVTSSHILL